MGWLIDRGWIFIPATRTWHRIEPDENGDIPLIGSCDPAGYSFAEAVVEELKPRHPAWRVALLTLYILLVIATTVRMFP